MNVVLFQRFRKCIPSRPKRRLPYRTLHCCVGLPSRHFDGVTTVVNKLFNIVKPDYAFFGMKDAQQVAVIEQMVQDLNMDVTIVPCPIIREADGLALSSRNVYLKPEEREQALVLSASLRTAQEAIRQGQAATAGEIRTLLRDYISRSPLADIDYAELLTFPELVPVEDSYRIADEGRTVIMALAVRFGRTRLIDNALLQPKVGDPMFRTMMKSKIHRATVTEANLNYKITIDEDLMEAKRPSGE